MSGQLSRIENEALVFPIQTGEMVVPVEDCVIVSAVRIPIGKFGGSLRDFKVYDLGSFAVKAAIDGAGLDLEVVEEGDWQGRSY